MTLAAARQGQRWEDRDPEACAIEPLDPERQHVAVESERQHSKGGSGNWLGNAPNDANAFATALAISPPTRMIAPSPAPLTPSGLLGEGWFSSAIARMAGKSVAVGIR